MEWRSILGFENYEVSETGIVRRCVPDRQGRGIGKTIQPRAARANHIMICLRDNDGHRIERALAVHVANAFIQTRPSCHHEIFYKDKNQSNTNWRNLYWGVGFGQEVLDEDLIKWRSIPGYSDYEASNNGHVRRITAKKHRAVTGRLLHPSRCKRSRYLTVCVVSDEGSKKNLGVHRAVALAFCGIPPTTKHEAAHQNGKRDDNRAENLRWATVSENSQDRWKHGTMLIGSRASRTKLSEADVLEIKERLHSQASYGLSARLAKQYEVSWATIAAIKNGLSWKWMRTA